MVFRPNVQVWAQCASPSLVSPLLSEFPPPFRDLFWGKNMLEFDTYYGNFGNIIINGYILMSLHTCFLRNEKKRKYNCHNNAIMYGYA